MVLNSNIHVKGNKMKRETIQQGCHLTVGAHFLSHNVLKHTEKTETLDAVIVFKHSANLSQAHSQGREREGLPFSMFTSLQTCPWKTVDRLVSSLYRVK